MAHQNTSLDITNLSNGIKIVTDYMPESALAYSLWILRAGAAHDLDSALGTAHFHEHMFCYGNGLSDDFHFTSLTQDWPGGRNAGTSQSLTRIYMGSLPNRIRKFLEFVPHMVATPVLCPERMEIEREIIEQEFLRSQSDEKKSFQRFRVQEMYGNHVITKPVLGTHESIMSITRDDLVEYRNRNFLGGEMALITAGPIPHDEIVSMTAPVLSLIKEGQNHDLAPPEILLGEPKNHYDPKKTQKISMIFPVSIESDKSSIGTLLCKLLTQEFNQLLRENRVTYNSSVALAKSLDTHYIEFSVETSPEKVQQAFNLASEFIRNAHQHITAKRYDSMMDKQIYDDLKSLEQNRNSAHGRVSAIYNEFKRDRSIRSFDEVVDSRYVPTMDDAANLLSTVKSGTGLVLGWGPRNDLPSIQL